MEKIHYTDAAGNKVDPGDAVNRAVRVSPTGSLEKRFGVAKGSPATVNQPTDNIIYQPVAGNSVRLKWLCIYSDPSNTSPVLATVRIGATEIYRVPFPANISAFSHSSIREGSTNDALIVNLSAAQTIYVNLDVEEFV